MSVKMRQELEKKVARLAIEGLLAEGFHLAVFDGEEEFPRSRDPQKILNAMMTTDEDYLIVYNSASATWRCGWVRFVYGNDGWDVINDYTTNLEYALAAANKLADSYM